METMKDTCAIQVDIFTRLPSRESVFWGKKSSDSIWHTSVSHLARLRVARFKLQVSSHGLS